MSTSAASAPRPARRRIAQALLAFTVLSAPGSTTFSADPSAAPPHITPDGGLNLVVSTRGATILSAQHNYGVMDTEDLFAASGVSDSILYTIRISSPTDAKANEEFSRHKIERTVRRADLANAERLSLLYGEDDPRVLPGQTFAEVSTAVLNRLKTQGESPFVLGAKEMDKMFAGLASATAGVGGAKSGIPVNLGSMFSLMGTVRHYYRGTLHRRESADVPFPVLLDGTRTTLPAVHAAGDFTFGTDEPRPAELWIFDNPNYPIALQWQFMGVVQTVTRIDTPPEGPEEQGRRPKLKGPAGGFQSDLAGKSCRTELHGVYFNTASAQLLPESEPMLQSVAALIRENPQWNLTVEGHTDNIGSAEYNQDLSQRRAEAVRQALIKRGVPAAQLSAKGYGLTRPVETNDTVQGRAHNRRVELARKCP